jgi:hypothetical protein
VEEEVYGGIQSYDWEGEAVEETGVVILEEKMWDILYMYWYHRQKVEGHAVCPIKFLIIFNWSEVDNASLFPPY